MRDAEILILAIEKQPCLWDVKHANYHNREQKTIAWQNVCKDVIDNWDSCSKTDKYNKCTELRKKWTNIRDYYRKDLHRNKKVREGTRRHKRYVYADRLSFLRPLFHKENSDGRYHSDDSNSHLASESSEEQKFRPDDNNDSILRQSSPSPSPPISIHSSSKKKKAAPNQIAKALHQGEKATDISQDEDDDTKFLLSFRGDMKRMNVDQKVDFKLGMLQLIKNIRTK